MSSSVRTAALANAEGALAASLEAPDNRRSAVLRLGLGCNVTCPFCNVPWESYNYPMKLPVKAVKEEILKLAASGVEALEFSGGEPTIWPELAGIIEASRAAGFKRVGIQTNAVNLGRFSGAAKKLKESGLTHACVSLHSSNPKIHDFLVAKKGAFQKCVSGILNLLEAGVEVILDPVVTTVNFKTLPALMEYAASKLKGVRHVSIIIVQPHGRAWKNWNLVPRYGEISPYIEKAVDRGEALGLSVNNPFCGLPLCVGGWHKRLESNVEYCESLAGHAPGDGEKFHPPECSACVAKKFCGGIWKEYPLIHPVSDLRPFDKL